MFRAPAAPATRAARPGAQAPVGRAPDERGVHADSYQFGFSGVAKLRYLLSSVSMSPNSQN